MSQNRINNFRTLQITDNEFQNFTKISLKNPLKILDAEEAYLFFSTQTACKEKFFTRYHPEAFSSRINKSVVMYLRDIFSFANQDSENDFFAFLDFDNIANLEIRGEIFRNETLAIKSNLIFRIIPNRCSDVYKLQVSNRFREVSNMRLRKINEKAEVLRPGIMIEDVNLELITNDLVENIINENLLSDDFNNYWNLYHADYSVSESNIEKSILLSSILKREFNLNNVNLLINKNLQFYNHVTNNLKYRTYFCEN